MSLSLRDLHPGHRTVLEATVRNYECKQIIMGFQVAHHELLKAQGPGAGMVREVCAGFVTRLHLFKH